jgi:RNA recognition motif-containing protein
MAISVIRCYNELTEAQRVALEEQVEAALVNQAISDLPAKEIDIRNARHNELGLVATTGWNMTTNATANGATVYINYTLGNTENLAFLEYTDPDDAIDSLEIANQTTQLAVLEGRHGGSRWQRINYPRDLFLFKKTETMIIRVRSHLVSTAIRVPLKVIKAEPKGTTVGGKPCPA